jgi:hypothetical protein
MPGNARAPKVSTLHGGRGRRHALAVMCGAMPVIAVACGDSGVTAAQGADAPCGLAPDPEALLRHTSDVRSVSLRGPITFESNMAWTGFSR